MQTMNTNRNNRIMMALAAGTMLGLTSIASAFPMMSWVDMGGAADGQSHLSGTQTRAIDFADLDLQRIESNAGNANALGGSADALDGQYHLSGSDLGNQGKAGIAARSSHTLSYNSDDASDASW